jgi:iron-sulfur cluster repair protein YtfE (RIC family)
MNAQAARTTLLAQHEQIRGDLARCVGLARRLRDGEPADAMFDEALTELRFDVDDHNTAEMRMVGDLLEGAAAWGTGLVDRMIEEHVGAHAAFRAALVGSPADVAARMQDLADELDAHMAAEERTFLNPQVLRDDVIQRRRRAAWHE